MRLVQYIIANKGANMSAGKLAAQVAHASAKGAVWTASRDRDLYANWDLSGHTKIVLEARDNDHIMWAREYIEGQIGGATFMIIDEGRTEVPALTPTALGFPILDKDKEAVKFAFETFPLYKDLAWEAWNSPKAMILGAPMEVKKRRFWR